MNPSNLRPGPSGAVEPPESPIHVEPEEFVVTAGNLLDGYEIHGPFESAEEANDWAAEVLRGETWTLGPLRPVLIR
jgi:hypothetical protein